MNAHYVLPIAMHLFKPKVPLVLYEVCKKQTGNNWWYICTDHLKAATRHT